MARLQPEEFEMLSSYIHTISGIHLEPTKGYLIENRLDSLLRDEGCTSFKELYHKAVADPLRLIEGRIIDAMTTGETLFFRDSGLFDLLRRKIVPELARKRATSTPPGLPIPLRIWSAGCSTGQEVYSLAMLLKDLMLDPPRYAIRLLGTDISDAALHQARQGRYSKFEVERGLTREKLLACFSHDKQGFKIREDLRSLATFKKVNLLESLDGLGKFDIILCRNVAIYFRDDKRTALFSKLSRMIEPDGYLLIGATESLGGTSPLFEARQENRTVYYQLKS
jgi:chemotaxis protein methyltransferase CheR